MKTRTAGDIIKDYRKRGYSDERLRLLAASRAEPLRSEILSILEAEGCVAPERQQNLLLEIEEISGEAIPDVGSNPDSFRHEELAEATACAQPEIEEALHTAAAPEISETEVLDAVASEIARDTERTITLVIEEEIEINLFAEMHTPEAEAQIVAEEPAKGASVDATPQTQEDSEDLIRAAYRRAGIEEPLDCHDSQDILDDGETEEYIPPQLTLIECENAKEENEGIILLQPQYALTPAQREQALQQQEDQAYYELADAIRLDFERYGRDIQREELPLVCGDFDDIARPAEEDWTAEPVLVSFDDGEDGVDGARLRSWLHEVKDELKMRQMEQEKLQQMLAGQEKQIQDARESVIAAQSFSGAQLLQIEEQSATIARLQNVVSDQRKEYTRINHENLCLNRELEKAREFLANNNRAVREQSGEICGLRALVEDLHAGSNTLIKHNMQLEALLAGKEKELDNLREKLALQNQRLAQMHAEKEQQKKLHEELGKLQLQYNILSTETVPNLQRDKEELVALVGEEIARGGELQEVAARRSRRMSYCITLAAAACVMLVLMPVIAMNRNETHRLEQEARLATQLAQAQNVQEAIELERNELKHRLQAVRAEFSREKQAWQAQLTDLSRQLGQAQIMLTTDATPVRTGAGDFDPRLFDMQAVDGPVTGENGNYNRVVGVERWRQQQEQRQVTESTTAREQRTQNVTPPVSEAEKYRIVKVRRGEGLSQVLWREYRASSPEMIQQVSKLNNLSFDRRGNPILLLDQELKLPVNPSTAMLQ